MLMIIKLFLLILDKELCGSRIGDKVFFLGYPVIEVTPPFVLISIGILMRELNTSTCNSNMIQNRTKQATHYLLIVLQVIYMYTTTAIFALHCRERN